MTRLHRCLWLSDTSQANIFSHPTSDTYLNVTTHDVTALTSHLCSFPKKAFSPRRTERRRRRPLVWTTHSVFICSCALNILSFSAWWDWPQTSCCIAHAPSVWWGGSIFCCWWNQSPPTCDTYAFWLTRSDRTCEALKTTDDVHFTWPFYPDHTHLCIPLWHRKGHCN